MEKLTAEGIPVGIYMTYFARYSFPTRAERMEGKNLGRRTDRGFRVHLPDRRIIEISTHSLHFSSIKEEVSYARKKIQRRLGPTPPEIPLY